MHDSAASGACWADVLGVHDDGTAAVARTTTAMWERQHPTQDATCQTEALAGPDASTGTSSHGGGINAMLMQAAHQEVQRLKQLNQQLLEQHAAGETHVQASQLICPQSSSMYCM